MPDPWVIPRRAFLGSLAAGAAGFAAFGPRGERERPDGRIVLDYWEKWSGHEGRAMQAIVDRFNESQPRIFVRYLVTAGVDEKGMVAIAGGSPPDLLGLYAYNIPLFAESGAIVPLDEIAPTLSASRYAQGLRPFVVHPARDGTPKTWAVISSAGTLALYYNKARLAEVGMATPPVTMEGFDDLNRRLTVMNGNDIARAGFIHAEPGWWSWVWSQPFGGTLWDSSSETSRLAAPETIRGYDWVRSTSMAFPRDAFARFRARFGNYDSPLNAFLTGHLAMIVQGPWLANVIETHHDKPARDAGRPALDYGVIPLPAIAALRDDARPIGAAEADVVVVPRGVKHPEACVEFLAFCQQQANLESLARAHFKNSPLATSSAEFMRTHPNKGVAAFDAIANSPRSFVTPRTRVWPEIKREMDQMMDFFFRGEGTAAEVLTRVSARVDDILARNKAKRIRRSSVARFSEPGFSGTPHA
jgi:multiple sugar transport system substrate-binding protein